MPAARAGKGPAAFPVSKAADLFLLTSEKVEKNIYIIIKEKETRIFCKSLGICIGEDILGITSAAPAAPLEAARNGLSGH